MIDDEDYNNNEDEEVEGEQVRVSLILSPEFRERHPHWRVSEAPLAVPSGLTRSGLSAVLKQLLAEQLNDAISRDGDGDEEKAEEDPLANVQFDFLLGKAKPSSTSSLSNARLLRGGIEAQARKLGISLEEAVPIVYFPLRQYRPSDARPTNKLPDWIASLRYDPKSDVVVAACYDGSLHCYQQYDAQQNASLLAPMASTRAHVGAVKCCAVHNRPGRGMVIATGAMDHSLRLHRLVRNHDDDDKEGNDDGTARLELMADCVGHVASVEAVAFAPPQGDGGANAVLRLASGDFAGGVCLWTHSANDDADPDPRQVATRKKAKTSTTTSTSVPACDVAPAHSLQAHAGNVSGLSFGNHLFRMSSADLSDVAAVDVSPHRLVTGSWDHSIKLWDVERQDNLLTLNGSRVVSCLDTSYHTEGIVATGHPDCTIRLWDVRIAGGSSGSLSASSTSPIVTADQTTWRPSHRAWITSVAWSVESPYHLLSSSHDGTVKLWDLRASLPVQTLRVAVGDDKEEDDKKVLCAAFGRHDERIYAGGTDGNVRSYDSSLGSRATREQ